MNTELKSNQTNSDFIIDCGDILLREYKNLLRKELNHGYLFR